MCLPRRSHPGKEIVRMGKRPGWRAILARSGYAIPSPAAAAAAAGGPLTPGISSLGVVLPVLESVGCVLPFAIWGFFFNWEGVLQVL